MATNSHHHQHHQHQQQQQQVVGGWRNPTLPEVIEYLSHSSNEIRANAAAYLQHLCYQDDTMKAETRSLGGIGRLVALLGADNGDVCRNACGALRNLSYGKHNDDNKLEMRDQAAIPALVRLLRRTGDESVKESITAVLWNLSSCEEIKEPILHDGLATLVKHAIVPYVVASAPKPTAAAAAAATNGTKSASAQTVASSSSSSSQAQYSTVLTNATGVLRNCSSNLQFANCYEARKKLRDSDGLIDALMRIMNEAVEPYGNAATSAERHQQLSGG